MGLKEHGETLAAMSGIPFISTDLSAKQRTELRNRIDSGELTAIIATSLYDESVNVPSLKVLINAAGYSPQNAQTQRHGRILRRTGKSAKFFDFYDSWESKMLEHSKKRIKYMKAEGHDVEVVGGPPKPPGGGGIIESIFG